MDAEEEGDGAEELVAVDLRGGAGQAGEDGGLEEIADADHAFAASEDAAAGFGGGFDLGFDRSVTPEGWRGGRCRCRPAWGRRP